MIDISTNRELYLFDSVERVFRSLEYAKSLPIPDWKEETIFHFYWRVPKEFGRKQVLPVKSAVATQDLSRTKIILWSNVDLRDNPHVKPLLPFIPLVPLLPASPLTPLVPDVPLVPFIPLVPLVPFAPP